MPENSRKFLWIGLAAGVFVLAVAAAVFFVFSPGDLGKKSPATAGASEDYLALPPQPSDGTATGPTDPGAAQGSAQNGGDIIIVYGEDSAAKQSPAPASSAPAAAAPAYTPSSSYAPSSSQSAAPAPSPTPAPSPAPTPKAAAPVPAPAPAPAAVKASPPPAPKAPAAKVTAAPKPSAAPAPGSGYWIQTGSFVQKSGADALKQGMEAQNLPVRINVKDIDGKSYYQVRVGPYSSREEASKWLGTVKAVPGASSGSFITQ